MTEKWEVIVVGAGPVGLLAANLLGAKGIRTLLIEQEERHKQGSRAIGVMPPSLEILATIGLAQRISDLGVKVTVARVYGRHKALGRVAFDGLQGEFQYILAVPQQSTEEILIAGLERFPCVTVMRGTRAIDVIQNRDSVNLAVKYRNSSLSYEGVFLLACDGDRSTIRERINLDISKHRYRHAFLMGDFLDESDLKDEARLFFTPNGAVESFPLPQGIRRWIVQTQEFQKNPKADVLQTLVAERAGYSLRLESLLDLSPFAIKKQLSAAYYKGRVLLAGDAAHVMPPIGGQGMNTGFADVWMATEILSRISKQDGDHVPLLQKYEKCRVQAAHVATTRAALSMGIGTLKGPVASAIRNGIIWFALKTPLAKWFPSRFSMQTIPYGTMKKIRAEIGNR